MKFLTIGQNVRLVCVQFDRGTIWILDLVFVEKKYDRLCEKLEIKWI